MGSIFSDFDPFNIQKILEVTFLIFAKVLVKEKSMPSKKYQFLYFCDFHGNICYAPKI